MTKFYESQPAELPPTLPAGTRSKNKMPYVAAKTVALHGGCYMGDWGEAHVGGIEAEWIDWASVAIRDSWPPCRDCGGSVHPGASAPGGVCGKCAVRVKPDPYTEHRLKEPACFTSMADLAARARNKAALRREAERPRGNRADAIEFAKAHPWEEFE